MHFYSSEADSRGEDDGGSRFTLSPVFEAELSAMEAKRRDLNVRLVDGAGSLSPTEFGDMAKELNRLEPIVAKWEAVVALREERAEAEELLAGGDGADDEMAALAGEEIDRVEEELARLEDELVVTLMPPEKEDERDVILEVRAGAGGLEAALFATEVLRMYEIYAEKRGWRWSVVEQSENDLGGVREASVSVTGQNVFSALKFESGVHRVQRIPTTDSAGRIHTSTVTVAVMPEAEEAELTLNDSDIRIDTFRASGRGGQHVNTTDSAIRVVHIPTGTMVSCQDERSQHKNKASALAVLRARLYDIEQQKLHTERSAERRSQIGRGDRSERIRTYNFPQERITDHRVPVSLSGMDAMLRGDLLDGLVARLRRKEVEDYVAARTATAARAQS